jgi:hypothetical protein
MTLPRRLQDQSEGLPLHVGDARISTACTAPAPLDRWWATVLALGLAVLAFAIHVQSAGAVIVPAVTIDGPSSEIVGFGGVAMAEDGTGGRGCARVRLAL